MDSYIHSLRIKFFENHPRYLFIYFFFLFLDFFNFCWEIEIHRRNVETDIIKIFNAI